MFITELFLVALSILLALVAQRIEQVCSTHKVVGSNPTEGTSKSSLGYIKLLSDFVPINHSKLVQQGEPKDSNIGM